MTTSSSDDPADQTPLIGLSLSRCVRDIIRGEVPLERVQKIVARTWCQTEDDWDTVVNVYCKDYWYDDPARAREIVAQLRAEGRIEQFRMGDPTLSRHLGNGNWVADMSQATPTRPMWPEWVRDLHKH